MAISSISSNTSSYVSQLSQTQQTTSNSSTQGVGKPHHHEHGKKPPFGDAITQALSQAGVTVNQGEQNSQVDSFMKELFTALRSQGALDQTDSSTQNTEGTQGKRKPNPEAFKQDLASLLSKVSSSDTSDPTVAKLQEAFKSLVGDNSSSTLQSFLQSLSDNIANSSTTTGNVINTSA